MFLSPGPGLKPFVIISDSSSPVKIYGQPFTVYSTSPVFWDIPLIQFVNVPYITITISGKIRGFMWLWSHLNGITIPLPPLLYKERLEIWSLIKAFGLNSNFPIIFSFLDSLLVGIDEEIHEDLPDLLTYEAIRPFNTLPLISDGIREVPPFDREYANRVIDKKRPFPTLNIVRSKKGNCYIFEFTAITGKTLYYISTNKIKESGPTVPGELQMLPLQPTDEEGVTTSYVTEDIGFIKAFETKITVYSAYTVRDHEVTPTPVESPNIPSLPREIYHYNVPSLIKYKIGPYLLEGSPLTLRSRSPSFSGSISEDKETDYPAIIYVWSYLNGIVDGCERPHYNISYESLLKCWYYIRYFRIPLTTLFVQFYLTDLFERTPRRKDAKLYRILLDIHRESPYAKAVYKRDSTSLSYEESVLEAIREI